MQQEVRANVSQKGEFIRKDSGYRDWIKKGSSAFPPAKNRYHLYVSYACPWAHRTLIVRALKGLTNVISISIVHPTFQQTREGDSHIGWAFSDKVLKSPTGYGEFKGIDTIPDTINNFKFVRDIYESVNDKVGKYSVPVLYDTVSKQIVNNESSEIIQMFNSEFNEFAENPDLDLNPENLKKLQSEIDPDIYNKINNGVYRCGFAQSQYAYDNAVKELFEQLDVVEEKLSKQRYLTGDKLTLSDIRLWVTLVRFDEVYVVYFKTNKKFIHQYPNLLNFCRDLYQLQGVAKTLNMYHIKTHYFSSHPNLNFYGIVPAGCGFEDMLKEKHDRARF